MLIPAELEVLYGGLSEPLALAALRLGVSVPGFGCDNVACEGLSGFDCGARRPDRSRGWRHRRRDLKHLGHHPGLSECARLVVYGFIRPVSARGSLFSVHRLSQAGLSAFAAKGTGV